MFVTCDVLLAKKPGTKPQMIPNFKGGFRSGPRGRGAEGPRGRGHPFSLKFCVTVIELSEKYKVSLQMTSGQVSRPPLSEFSGSTPEFQPKMSP